MGFNYDKNKAREESGAQWTSYSDLFMGLSVVFLLLYVTASLRQGTSGLQQQMEHQRLTQENQDLKNQLKVYNTLQQDYMETGATSEEQNVYHELMDKLNLLKEKAEDEKNELRQKATENEKKEMALNQYQKLIRNIINSNMISTARIKRRDNIIVKKDEAISDLEKSVAEKREIIAQGEKTIQSINAKLSQKIKALQWSYKNQEITKKKLDAETARLKAESAQQVGSLQSQNEQIKEQLEQVAGRLESTSQQLEVAHGTIEQQKQEKQGLQKELEQTAAKYGQQIQVLQGDFEAQKAKERAAFEAELRRAQLTGEARAKREAQFKAQAEQKARELGDKLANLNSKMRDTEGQLVKAKAQAEARRVIAREIKRNFADAGVKADVDPETGDVLLDFGDQYFETGSSNLRPGMTTILRKALPVYSKTLLENKKFADKITAVEIVGFASPTYKGKYVDPKSLSNEDRKAVDYNLDLSYKRARSIFQYVFDTNQMTFPHQRRLLPLVKVTGRSFLTESQSERGIASGTAEREFCERYDCKKAQRVIIKFGFEK